MKKKNNEETAKIKTTNYPMDGHNIFCNRCYGRKHLCPATGTRLKDGRCKL